MYFEQNVSTTPAWISCMTFRAEIHVSFGMNGENFGDPFTFHVVP